MVINLNYDIANYRDDNTPYSTPIKTAIKSSYQNL